MPFALQYAQQLIDRRMLQRCSPRGEFLRPNVPKPEARPLLKTRTTRLPMQGTEDRAG